MDDDHIEKMFKKTIKEINKSQKSPSQSPSVSNFNGTMLDSLELFDEGENTQSSIFTSINSPRKMGRNTRQLNTVRSPAGAPRTSPNRFLGASGSESP